MCNIESMARDGTSCNFNQRGSSPSFIEDGLCRQTESQDGGAAALQRGTRRERAAILGATNRAARRRRFRPPFQTMWARQADIGGLWKELKEEWTTGLEKKKREHDLELKQLKEEVRSGNQRRESMEQEIKRGEELLKQEVGRGNWEREYLRKATEEWWEELKKKNKKRDELRREAVERGDKMSKEACKLRKELEKKTYEFQKHQDKETELQNELRMVREERTTAENETLRNHTVQIEQLEAKARSECAEMRKELEKKVSELLKHETKERGLQNELKMLKEERKRTENETLRNHTVQIEQLEAKARLQNEMQERVMKEERMRQEKEIRRLKDTTRLEREEREEQWDRKQKEHEAEVDQLEEKARLEYEEIEKEQRMKHTKEMNQMKQTMKLEKEGQERKQGRVVREQRMKHKKDIIQMKKTTKLEKEGQERKQGRVMREQRMKHRKEMSQLKETMRLENEEQERLWDRKQKQNEVEMNELKERVKLKSREMEKLREENEQLMGLREEEQLRWEGKWSQKETETNKCTETREIEGELDGVSDEHTHTEVVEDHEGELADCLETRCEQLDGLLQERRETLFSLEADRDQVSSVVSSELEGASAVDRCTCSLGGMETPGPLVVARIPSVIVPVCVVKGVSAPPRVSGVVASVPECVLPSTPCTSEEAVCASETVCVSETPRVSAPACVSGAVCENGAPRVSGAACAPETARVCEQPCVSERPSVRGTACVRSLYVREMTVGMREHAAASPGVSVMECSLSVVTRRCARVERRRRLRQLRDKGRVAAVVGMGTAPGLPSSEREVRAVLRTRPPRARLLE